MESSKMEVEQVEGKGDGGEESVASGPVIIPPEEGSAKGPDGVDSASGDTADEGGDTMDVGTVTVKVEAEALDLDSSDSRPEGEGPEGEGAEDVEMKTISSSVLDTTEVTATAGVGTQPETAGTADQTQGEKVDDKPLEKSVVVPITSPVIPSLGQAKKEGEGGKVKVSFVSNKEILPSVPPSQPEGAEMKEDAKKDEPSSSVGMGLNKLLASTKSLSFALAKPNSGMEGVVVKGTQKRKMQSGCSNLTCTSTSTDLVIAKKAAMMYFQFNTDYKKVHKICTACNREAENFVLNSVNALKNQQNVFQHKPKPMSSGSDGEIIEVKQDDEDDDPRDVKILHDEANQKFQVAGNLNTIVSELMRKISLNEAVQKCEDHALLEAKCLDEDFALIDKQISAVEMQVMENKKMYDMVTGNYQALPVIMEQVDISANGNIVKTPALNEHLQNVPNLPSNIKAMIPTLPAAVPRPRKAKENRNYTDDGEIMEVDVPASKKATQCPLAKPPKEIPRVLPSANDPVYAQSKTLLHFWLKARIVEKVQMGNGRPSEFIVRFEKRTGTSTSTRQLVKQVTAKQIAYNTSCPFVLVVGTRIVAKFRDDLKTDPTGDGQFYAGIVAEPPSSTNDYRYLVFFDDGYAQYVNYQDVLLVYDSSKEVWADVYQDSADFIKTYLTKYPERPMVRLSLGQVVTTEWNGKWWVARVVELDCSLVKMKFDGDGRLEWIYRGSTRLSPLFEKESRQKQRKIQNRTARRHTNVPFNKNHPRIEYNYDDGPNKSKSNKAKKSTGAHQVLEKEYNAATRRIAQLDYGEYEGTIIKRPIPESAPKTREYVPHECNHACVYDYDENNKEFRKMSPLAIPLHLGFSREIAKNPKRTVFYRGPCGARIRDLDEMYDYLTQTNCNVPIDHFCFDLAVDCLNEFRHSRQHSFLPDLTYGKETVPVQVVNAFDYEYPPYVEYASQRIAGSGVHLNTDPEFLVGCECEDDCRDKSKCSCWQMTFQGLSFTKLSSEEYPYKGYEHRRLKDHIVSGIYECNPRCKCAKTCCNRVAQTGLKVPLQVFKTAAKGWGIRPLFDIPEGAFICIYAGQVLTDQGANEDGQQFGDEYLAELDFIESIENVKADYESDVTDIESEEPGERSRRRKEQRKQQEDQADSEEEIDSHAGDSSFRVRLKQSGNTERTVNTRGKNNNGGKNGKQNSDSDEDDGGARPRSHFNANMESTQLKRATRRPLRQYFGDDEDCYIMDAKTTGNIGRYLNHSCQPNVFVQNVFVDTHDLRFPWVAFFAGKHIRAGSELTWDYSYEIGSVPNKVLFCYCGSVDCRGRLL